MEYDFTIGDKKYTVNIEKRNPDSLVDLKATINGEQFGLDVLSISPNCFMLSADGRNHRAYAVSNESLVFVYIDGKVIRLEKDLGDQQKFSREGMEFGARDEVTTPMPGKVVKILVKEGEKVTIKQPLVIVESMKMENEIKSPANGTIKSIHFRPGDLVESGRPIIKIEPD